MKEDVFDDIREVDSNNSVNANMSFNTPEEYFDPNEAEFIPPSGKTGTINAVGVQSEFESNDVIACQICTFHNPLSATTCGACENSLF